MTAKALSERDIITYFTGVRAATFEEDFIIEKLWPDNSGNDERMHKAIGRLRSFLRKIDPSLSIINKNGTYRLIISEKSLVKRNS